MHETQPAARLSNLLQANAELVDEILARLRALQLAMVGQRRRAATQKLIRYMSGGSGCWQRIHQPDNSYRILEQAFFKIISLPVRWSRGLPSQLDVGRWMLDVGRSVDRIVIDNR